MKKIFWEYLLVNNILILIILIYIILIKYFYIYNYFTINLLPLKLKYKWKIQEKLQEQLIDISYEDYLKKNGSKL